MPRLASALRSAVPADLHVRERAALTLRCAFLSRVAGMPFAAISIVPPGVESSGTSRMVTRGPGGVSFFNSSTLTPLGLGLQDAGVRGSPAAGRCGFARAGTVWTPRALLAAAEAAATSPHCRDCTRSEGRTRSCQMSSNPGGQQPHTSVVSRTTTVAHFREL